jgi:Spy/CpxP family protein refolding chaperone
MRISTKLLTLAAVAAMAGTALAQAPQGPTYGPGMMGPGMGPGMMGGYGPGYGPGGGRGYGPGYGMGPGMMGGGMMGAYGMGPGMMGPGTMGGYGLGYGMGPGMMGGSLAALDLTDAQRAQINKVRDEVRRKNWDVMGKMQDETAKLRDAYAADKRDRAAILGAYKRIGELRLQRIENAFDAREKIEGVLTKEQREQLRRWGPGWRMGADE